MEKDLLLTHVNGAKLESLIAQLLDEGYTIAGSVAGNLEGDAVIDALVATQREAGAPAVLLDTAGLSPALADWQPILIDNLVATEKLLRAIEPSLTSGSFASKRKFIRIWERRAPGWAKRGARIVLISPGIILTPIARKEAEHDAMSLAVVEATPVGRWGTAMDIANAVRFLASDSASFITGCDLRIDDGVSPAMNSPLH
jgi:hypothetical protein